MPDPVQGSSQPNPNFAKNDVAIANIDTTCEQRASNGWKFVQAVYAGTVGNVVLIFQKGS